MEFRPTAAQQTDHPASALSRRRSIAAQRHPGAYGLACVHIDCLGSRSRSKANGRQSFNDKCCVSLVWLCNTSTAHHQARSPITCAVPTLHHTQLERMPLAGDCKMRQVMLDTGRPTGSTSCDRSRKPLGHGRVPPMLLGRPWTRKPGRTKQEAGEARLASTSYAECLFTPGHPPSIPPVHCRSPLQ